ncbi:hypothetical protein WA026_009933 [Henosepilachna vigintioctopunctata]|uniref:Uncharacterized protein n=1 Tax=Henosepilachna vigintioctopunctata TaxID=420089 RepID=A0AAW1TQN8_9CUCU
MKINLIFYVFLLYIHEIRRAKCERRISKRSLFFPLTTILQFNYGKRDLGESDINKLEFYKYFIEYLESSQLNGEECLLRMICELAKYPLDTDDFDSVIEKIVHFLFTPSLTFGEQEEEEQQTAYFKNFLGAEESGKRGEHCKTKYNMCEVPLASIFSKFFKKIN